MKVDVHAAINFVYIHTTHNVDTIQIREITICKSSSFSEMIKCGGGGLAGCCGIFFGMMTFGMLTFGMLTFGMLTFGMMTFGRAFIFPGSTNNFIPVPTT